jgi:hypothetical protein
MMYRSLSGQRWTANADARPVEQALTDYFRCPAAFASVGRPGGLSEEEGYFRFRGIVAFGRAAGVKPVRQIPADGMLPEVSAPRLTARDGVQLPFDLSEVVRNLREERYCQRPHHALEALTSTALARDLYYFLRPALPVPVRKHLQRARLSGWDRIRFPKWPVDSSVEDVMQQALAASLRASGARRVPFIWFWPEGAPAGAILTHDVEGSGGLDFCGALMDLDDSFGIKAAFQLIPERRERAANALIVRLRKRGFEVNLHDFNHDGYLFHTRRQFLARAAQINEYARELDCRGFRSGAMYREQQWFDAFEFSYDMSVPNVAHLEPQRGGCCTVMPYFVGRILELPLTTIQDYSLFHILNLYSTSLWQRQIEHIVSKNGLITILTHPDYLVETRARAVYSELLAQLARMRQEGELWLALPGEVDRWWRNRASMQLVPDGGGWRIEGPDSSRARVAYASLEGERLVYSVSGRQ